MENSIEAPKSTFRSIKKSLSVIGNLSVSTWWRSREDSDVICKEYRSSKDVEAFVEGLGSIPCTECLTDSCDHFSSSSHLPLHYDIIKLSLTDLRKFSSVSNQFHYPDDIEWQCISNENLKAVFKDASVIELNTALLWAAFTKRWELIIAFLELGAQINYNEPSYGLSALHLAAFVGSKEGTEVLLSQEGSDLNIMHKYYTPLHCSAFGDSPQTAQILLERGAHINALTNDPYSRNEGVLHCAVRANALNSVKLFCDIGANINQLDSSDRTPIHLAAELGCTECLKLLVNANGANVNLQTKENKSTALHLAAEGQYSDCIDILLDNGAIPSTTNDRGQTPLHVAAKVHSNDCVKILLKKGKADPNARDVDQRTPLHIAVSKSTRLHGSDVIRTLIRYGADVNAKDNEHYMPLHLAALNELSECAETLIMYDADITAKYKSGITALGMICRKIPTSVDAIRRKLDESISFTQEDSTNNGFELRIDFATTLQHCYPKEITLLTTMAHEGQKELLQHPICSAILYLKWKRIRKYYVYRGIFCLIFVLVLSSYVLTGLANNCYNVSKNISDANLMDDKDLCLNHSLTGEIISKNPFLIELQWYILIGLCMGKFLRKLCGLPGYSSYTQYVCNLENIIDWSGIITVFLISFKYTGRTYVWQNHVSAFGVLLGWINLLHVLGQFPVFGTYVAMYTSVQREFAKLLFLFSCLLMGFTVSFCVLFPESTVFSNIYIGYITVLVMTVGEVNFDLITDRYSTDPPFVLEGSMGVIYVLFVISVTIILINLLVGIAVNDIQGLKKTARVTKLMKQAKLISVIEKVMFKDYFVRKIWLEMFQCNTLLSAEGHGILNVKPLHHKEKGLPKDILLAAYEVARKQKKRNKHVLQKFRHPDKNKSLKNVKSELKKNDKPTESNINYELHELKNNISNLNNQMINIRNVVESNQRLMEQILRVISNSNDN